MAIRKKNDIDPDGVVITISWDKMTVGTSIFVPCLNTEKASRQIKAITNEKGWEIKQKVKIEGNKLGLRVWRFV
jgi:hypothetical protein